MKVAISHTKSPKVKNIDENLISPLYHISRFLIKFEVIAYLVVILSEWDSY